jgi:hypothetical protein
MSSKRASLDLPRSHKFKSRHLYLMQLMNKERVNKKLPKIKEEK